MKCIFLDLFLHKHIIRNTKKVNKNNLKNKKVYILKCSVIDNRKNDGIRIFKKPLTNKCSHDIIIVTETICVVRIIFL